MKTLAIWLVVGAACSGKAEPVHKAAKSRGKLEVVYDLDLEKAVDDKLSLIKRDLVAQLGDKVTITLSPTQIVTVTPTEPTHDPEIRDRVTQSYGDTIAWHDCTPTAGPGALCLKLAPDYAEAVQKAALASAVQIIRERLDAEKIDGSSVTARGKQIVVVLGGDPAQLKALRAMIPQSHRLEMKVVDDGSAYMKQVFRHVGSEGRSSTPTDPAAIAAGVHADIDQWRPEDGGTTHTDYYLVAPDRRALEHYFAGLAASDPSFKLPDDHVLAFERFEPSEPGGTAMWRSYYVERIAVITGKDIAHANAAQDPNTNRAIVLLEFGRNGAAVFGDLTMRIVGKKLATLLDGQIMSAPIINGAILGGRASIAMGGSDAAAAQQAATELAQALNAGALPTPLVEVSVTSVP